jgi:adenylate cyclase
VNTASRLEGQNKTYGTHLLVSETTRRAIADGFVCREVDRIKVKGKNVAVAIYEVMAASDAAVAPGARELARVFEEGLAAYRRQAWDEAIATFERIREQHPDDGPTHLYLERCLDLRKEPVRAGWDGVYVAKTK